MALSVQYFSIQIQFVQLNFFFQAEDGIRDQPRSRGLGDVYKRQTVMPRKFEQNQTFHFYDGAECPILLNSNSIRATQFFFSRNPKFISRNSNILPVYFKLI